MSIFDTFFDPCWIHVGLLFVFWALFGPSMGIRWAPFCFLECLLSPRRRHCWLMGPFLLILRSHLLLSGSIFGVRVPLICLCSRSALRPSVFSMHHIQTRNQSASSMITVTVSHHQVKVSGKYASKNALLTAHAARSAALTSSIYICSQLGGICVQTIFRNLVKKICPSSAKSICYFSCCH